MKSLFKIYRRYIFSASGITAVVLFVNLAVLACTGIYFQVQNQTGLETVGRGQLQTVASCLLDDGSGGRRMGEEGYAYLESTDACFAFWLDEEGNRAWSWQVPEEIPEHFSIGQIASFSRWYLMDYPVHVWNTEGGLLVIANEKDSAAKYIVEFSPDSLRNVPAFLLIILLSNLLLIFLLAVLSGYRMYAALRPVVYGLERLEKGQRAAVPERGIAEELNRKLNQVSRILEEQRENLTKRDTARTEWIAGVSHDIRTPLSMVMGYADNLENDLSLPERPRKEAAIIKEQSLKIKTLIEDLNLTSKLEYHMQPLRAEEYMPAALLRKIVASYLNQEIEGHELDLDVSDELEGVMMLGDVRLLTRALQNLIGTSIRHNRTCRILVSGTVETEDGVRLCRLSVRDDGSGIPKAVQSVLEGKGQKGGPHVCGLRIVMQIVRAHGGRMEISEDGREVDMILPVYGTLEERKKRAGKKKWWEILWYGEGR